jgi:ABC-type microcin C transport system duplicated ATPase subunit YejF
LGVAYNTVMRAIVALEAGGVLAKVGEGKRDRVFCAQAILKILDEPARLVPEACVSV